MRLYSLQTYDIVIGLVYALLQHPPPIQHYYNIMNSLQNKVFLVSKEK